MNEDILVYGEETPTDEMRRLFFEDEDEESANYESKLVLNTITILFNINTNNPYRYEKH